MRSDDNLSLGEKFVVLVFVLVLIAVILSVISLVTMFLWNWLMPYLFGIPQISFWQALGLYFLLSIIGSAVRGCSNRKS